MSFEIFQSICLAIASNGKRAKVLLGDELITKIGNIMYVTYLRELQRDVAFKACKNILQSTDILKIKY